MNPNFFFNNTTFSVQPPYITGHSIFLTLVTFLTPLSFDPMSFNHIIDPGSFDPMSVNLGLCTMNFEL